MRLMGTPLMESVAKESKLKPPITETNVLKMNKNFHSALELYYYLCAYDKDGYTAERIVRTVDLSAEALSGEFAEVAALGAFLTYEHGMGLGDALKTRYDAEEARRRQAEADARSARLERLRRQAKAAGVSLEEYLLLLEQHGNDLEAENARLRADRENLERLTEAFEALKLENAENIRTAEERERQLRDQAAAHQEEIARLGEEHAAAIETLNGEHAEEIGKLNEAHAQEIETNRAAYGEQMKRQRAEFDALCANYDKRLGDMSAACERAAKAQAETAAQFERVDRERTMYAAKYNALRYANGQTAEEDFTSPEAFGEIEKQFNLFKAFFREEWKKTRKRIRREVFETLKKPAGQQEEGVQGDVPAQSGADGMQNAAPADGAAETDKEGVEG